MQNSDDASTSIGPSDRGHSVKMLITLYNFKQTLLTNDIMKNMKIENKEIKK